MEEAVKKAKKEMEEIREGNTQDPPVEEEELVEEETVEEVGEKIRKRQLEKKLKEQK